MKKCETLLFLIALSCLTMAASNHDLADYSNPSTFEPVSIMANREIHTSQTKPTMTSLTPTTLNVKIPLEGFYTVAIMSPSGRKLYSRTFALAYGDRVITLEGFNSPTGIVLVDIFGAGVRSVQKMTIREK